MNISPQQLRLWKQVLTRTLKLLKPPPCLPVWAWGELRRRMGKNVTAKPGRYRTSFAPYQRQMQESFTDPDVQTTVLYMGKRLGKTEAINNLHGSIIEQDPKNILVVYPTLDSAKKWSKQFFSPMVRATAKLRQLIRETGRREANNTILSKEYPGGTISAIGSNSPNGFRQVQAPVVTCDEIDAMENGPEGDPVELAFGRAENYRDNIQVVSSTATRVVPVNSEKPESVYCHILKRKMEAPTGSRIHDWWLKSDQRMWFVPCGCGKYHVLEWGNVKWEPGKPETAWYEAPCCGAKWDDYTRVKAICAGEWRAMVPFKGIRGYWLNGLNTTFPAKKGFKSKLHQFAEDFLRAYKSGEAAVVYWENTFLCRPHEEKAEKGDAGPLLDRAEDYTPQTLPENVILLTAQCDVQKTWIQVEVMGHGFDEETWGVSFEKIEGDTEGEEVWADLSERLRKTYKRSDGVELAITAVAIDMRHKGERVRKFVRNCGLPRVYPVYGSGASSNAATHPVLVTSRFDKRHRMRTYAVATREAKDILFARMKIEDEGPRFMHFPKGSGYSEEYFRQLAESEVKKTKYLNGFPVQFYEKVRERNEALDLRVYGLACVDILKPNFTAIAKRLKPNEPPPEPPKEYVLRPDDTPKPTANPKPKFINRPPRMGGGFVNGWRK